MSDIEIIKKYGSIENYIYELEQENKELKEGNTIYNQFVNYKNWYFDYVDKYENLQQENKQLKDKLDNNTKIYLNTSKYASECEGKMVTYKYERDLYKEVIEEAKEYVNNHIHQETFTGYMDSYELKKLLQILDKVKEN